jgi:hypothetical protein
MTCVGCGSFFETQDNYCGVCGISLQTERGVQASISWKLSFVVATLGILRGLSGVGKAYSKGSRGQYAQESDLRWRERLHGQLLEKEAIYEANPSSANAASLREAKKLYGKSLQ